MKTQRCRENTEESTCQDDATRRDAMSGPSEWCPGWESNPHEEKSPEDFKSSASAIPPPGHRQIIKINMRAVPAQTKCEECSKGDEAGQRAGHAMLPCARSSQEPWRCLSEATIPSSSTPASQNRAHRGPRFARDDNLRGRLGAAE